jgi:hypothetical protein
MVRVAVPAVVPVMLTGLVEPKLTVGGYCEPVGLEVTEAVSTTLPAKPLAGVRVTVDVFAVVAPGVRVTAVPVTEKPGAGRLIVYVALPTGLTEPLAMAMALTVSDDDTINGLT